MRRGTVLGVLIGVGALSLAVAGYQGQEQGRGGRGEGRGGRGDAGRGEGRGQAQAQPGRLVEVTRVKENLYVMMNGGGNTSVLLTDNGVVVVDTKLPGWGQPVLEKIKGLTDKPITTIVNTHTHGDHVSGQLEYPGTIEVVAHENTKTNMEKLDPFKQPANAKWLPSRTYKDKLSLGTGRDRIDLYYFGPGHTNGDTWVVFPALRVMHAADMFPGKTVPFIDGTSGGSGVAYPQTLARAISTLKDAEYVIPGHSTLMSWAEFREFADFAKDLVTWAEAQMKAGKTTEQAAAEYKIPEKYKGYAIPPAPAPQRLKGDLDVIYGELKR